MLLKPGEKTPMKNLFTLIFVFFILQSFAQEYGKEGYQEKRFDEAIQSLKEKEFEQRGEIISLALTHKDNKKLLNSLKKTVKNITQSNPLYRQESVSMSKRKVFFSLKYYKH